MQNFRTLGQPLGEKSNPSRGERKRRKRNKDVNRGPTFCLQGQRTHLARNKQKFKARNKSASLASVCNQQQKIG